MKILSAAAVLAASLTGTPALAQTDLVLSTFFPPQHFMYRELTAWGEEVESVTEGRVTVTIPAGSLAPPPRQYSAITSGVADVAMQANIFLLRKEPLIEVSMLPFLVADAEAASVALWQLYENELADAGMFADAHVLSLFHFGGGQTYTTDESPLTGVDDLKSRKMWALPGAATKLMVELGVSPVTTPAVQVSETVSSGVVSGLMGLNLESAIDFRITPYVKTATVFPLSISSVSFTFAMNPTKWEAISEEDQAAISTLSGAAFAQQVGAAAQEASDAARVQMEGEGITFHEADESFVSALEDAGQAQYDAFDKVAAEQDVDGAALVDAFRGAMTDAAR